MSLGTCQLQKPFQLSDGNQILPKDYLLNKKRRCAVSYNSQKMLNKTDISSRKAKAGTTQLNYIKRSRKNWLKICSSKLEFSHEKDSNFNVEFQQFLTKKLLPRTY